MGAEEYPQSQKENMSATSAPDPRTTASDGMVDSNGAQFKSGESAEARRRLSQSWWLQEIAAMTVSVMAWAALVGVLAGANGQPEDRWFKVISINAIVSILVTLARSMMMIGVSSSIAQAKWLYFSSAPRALYDMQLFDSASHGSYGSLAFLLRARVQVATLGAFLTILSVAVDAFSQQVVETQVRQVGESVGTAKFSYAHSYSGTAKMNAFSGLDLKSVDKGMRGAIFKGLNGLEITDPYSCPGTCSWEQTYTSLGFTSNCQNVSQATLSGQKCTTNGSLSNCTMVTPNGLTIGTYHADTRRWTVISTVADGTILHSAVLESFDPNNFLRVAVFQLLPDFDGQLGTLNNSIVTECSLSLTSYDYTNVRVNGTTISQNITEVPFTQNATIDLQNKVMKFNNFYLNETGRPSFNISGAEWSAIGDFFGSKQFVGMYLDPDENPNNGVAAMAFYNTNMTKVFEDLARSMTNQVRITKGGAKVGYGLTEVPIAFTVVHWEYLVLPLVTAGFSVILLVMTIILSRRSSGVPLWKSSALALLDHQVNKLDGTIVGNFHSLESLEKEAKLIKVKLL